MKRLYTFLAGALVLGVMATSTFAGDQGSCEKDKAAKNDAAKKMGKAETEKASSGAQKKESAGNDTLVIKARLVEIPGTFPPNDLYNYVYVMKYRVLKVMEGTYKEREILVGHYNPLIPRSQISDKMDEYVDGNVEKFEEGNKHVLTLVTPISKVWKEAMEDEYFDVKKDKYYALKAEVASK